MLDLQRQLYLFYVCRPFFEAVLLKEFLDFFFSLLGQGLTVSGASAAMIEAATNALATSPFCFVTPS